jgi:ribosomal protein S27E
VLSCPVCSKDQLVHVVGPAHTSCYYCGATWVQSGDEQEDISPVGKDIAEPRAPERLLPVATPVVHVGARP